MGQIRLEYLGWEGGRYAGEQIRCDTGQKGNICLYIVQHVGDELLSFFVMKKNDLGIKCVSIRMCTLFYIRTSNFYPRLNVLIFF